MHDQSSTLTLHQKAANRTSAIRSQDDKSACGFERAERFLLGLRRRAPRRTPLNWVLRLHQLEAFHRSVGRPPSRRADTPDERALAAWVRRQRDRGNLTAFQRARLDVSPAFTRSTHDSAWIRRATQLRNIILTTGEPPRWLETDPEQYQLRQWWTRQLHALRDNSLAPRRAAIVAELAALPARIELARRHPDTGQFRTSAAIPTTSERQQP